MQSDSIALDTIVPVTDSPPVESRSTLNRQNYFLPSITPLALILEIGLLIIVALVVTWQIGHAPPNQKMYGDEYEWLTNNNYLNSLTWTQYHQYPYWQPYIEAGQPQIEGPISFVLNPISTLPSLIYGPIVGLRVTVVLYAVFVTLGGWVLGRILGFGSLARLLLALLCLGKGNVLSMFADTSFQLAAQQTYIPWILAGLLGTLWLKKRRWPIVLLAVNFMLMFWAGYIWFTYPVIMFLSVLTLCYVIVIRIERINTQTTDGQPNVKRRWQADIRIDYPALRRVIGTGALTVGLTMATLLPLIAHAGAINAPSGVPVGPITDLGEVISNFFSPHYMQVIDVQDTYTYVLPLWFAVFVFIILLPLPVSFLWKLHDRRLRVFLVVTVIMAVFFTLWGHGGDPLIQFLYNTLPLLNRWNFVARVLGVASLCLAILAAARIDGFWKAIVDEQLLVRRIRWRVTWGGSAVTTIVALILIATSGAASLQLDAQWQAIIEMHNPQLAYGYYDQCLSWLREHNPQKVLIVYSTPHFSIYSFIKYQVVSYNVNQDYHIAPNLLDAIYAVDLHSATRPEYWIVLNNYERDYLVSLGYTPMLDSPEPAGVPCLWHTANALPFAYSVPLPVLEQDGASYKVLSLKEVQPIADDQVVLTPNQIAVVVSGTPDQASVLTVRTVNYPDWHVAVDGQDQPMTYVGGQLGVAIPKDGAAHQVLFYYVPWLFYVGVLITLLCVLLCVLYLLKAERFIADARKSRLYHFAMLIGARVGRVLLDPNLLEPHDE